VAAEMPFCARTKQKKTPSENTELYECRYYTHQCTYIRPETFTPLRVTAPTVSSPSFPSAAALPDVAASGFEAIPLQTPSLAVRSTYTFLKYQFAALSLGSVGIQAIQTSLA